MEAPTEDLFTADFSAALKTLVALQNQMAMPKCIQMGVMNGLGNSRIKIHHALFEVCRAMSFYIDLPTDMITAVR